MKHSVIPKQQPRAIPLYSFRQIVAAKASGRPLYRVEPDGTITWLK